MMEIASHPLFCKLSKDQLEKLYTLSEKVTLPPGTTIISEGEKSYDLFLVLKGTLSILKKSVDDILHDLGTEKEGDLIGKLAFILPGNRAATIKTKTPCELIKIDGGKIKSNPQYADLYAVLSAEIGKLVATNLIHTNEVTVKSMQAELASSKLLLAGGRFMAAIVFVASLYIFALSILEFAKKYFHDTTPGSIALIIAFSGLSFLTIWRSGFPLKNFGLTLHNWKRVTLEAIAFSIPLMLLIILLKWAAITFIPSLSPQTLFQPFIELKLAHAPSMAYFLMPLAYAAFCPVQEFIARGTLQSSFHLFLTKNTWQSTWYAIILANLLFSATHMHTSFGFAMLAFFPGLFWGWLFARQQSLIGVSISHIIIGFWAVYVVSFIHLL
jgi:CRP-like cAMP-binding protein